MQKETQKDFLDPAERKTQQTLGIKQAVQYAYQNSPYYRKVFDEAGLKPEQINNPLEFRQVPFTKKNDLRGAYPYGMAAVTLDKIIRIHASSGTTGKPIVAGYTRQDLDDWAAAVARICAMAGVKASDIAQISFGYGLFTGGFGLHYGLERLGATVVPFSSGNTERQLSLMQDFNTNVLVSTPSFALYMAETAIELGYKPAEFGLKIGLFGGEPCSDAMREDIEKHWKLKATVNYGLTEVVGPGISGECEERAGMHILEDIYFPEIIDPASGEVLPDGATGELVLTPLYKEGFPVLRYRTGDITRLISEACPCGRTTRRMDYIAGRSDDMIIIKGVNIFPSQIEEVLAGFSEVSPHYLLVLHKQKGFIKDLEVQIELSPEGFSDSFRQLEALEGRIRQRLRSTLSLAPRLKLMEPKSLERTTGKAKRITINEVE
ncbi:MAG: phenylacetate--CoA ligase [Firmicutes bacterium]|nr:phenylacetate--CoA ligase [Bacillota bacterium]